MQKTQKRNIKHLKKDSQKLKVDGFVIYFRLGNNGYASGVYRGKKEFPEKARRKDFTRA